MWFRKGTQNYMRPGDAKSAAYHANMAYRGVRTLQHLDTAEISEPFLPEKSTEIAKEGVTGFTAYQEWQGKRKLKKQAGL